MRSVIQRVSESSVKIDNRIVGRTGCGMVILLGIEDSDTKDDVNWLCGKIVRLRIFPDENQVMNLPVTDVDGEILLISQFTLHASTKKGNRPSYIRAARPEFAIPLYELFKNELEIMIGKPVQTGEFGANMKVSLINDGPVTIIIDSKNRE